MQIRMSAGAGLPRLAWTEGLEALGQQELVVTLPWPEGDVRDEQIKRLLQFIEVYISGQPKLILAGQTMEYGWTLLHFVTDEQRVGRLIIEELRDPYTFGEPEYVPGVTRAIALKAVQDEALRRNRITGDAQFPHRARTAIVCNRVTPETIGSLRPLEV
jgi:hypothetical protein